MRRAQPTSEQDAAALTVADLGRMPYAQAYERQCEAQERVLRFREEGGPVGMVLLVEHDPPVITVSRRPNARVHLLAGEHRLREMGVEVAETDRGGDITYHGPGQLVVYPILDLNRLGMGLHPYMRALEGVVIEVCRGFGVEAHRDACATGVWVGGQNGAVPGAGPTCDAQRGGVGRSGGSKICAMGVRVRRWVTMHGLALNVATDLSHFDLIVPCGLAGRTVTSLEKELGERRPSMVEVKAAMIERLREAFTPSARRRLPPAAPPCTPACDQ